MQKIMFNDRYGLTDAVIEGRKTMTRRLVSDRLWEMWTNYDDFCNSVIGGIARGGTSVSREYYRECDFFKDKCGYKVGEVVAVAQCYNDVVREFTDLAFVPGSTNKMFVRADLMPHQIRITGVRCERLRDISDEDCLKEGINASNSHEIGYGIPWVYEFAGSKMVYYTPREAFAALIDKVSGRGTWKSNPWVVAYEFELVK